MIIKLYSTYYGEKKLAFTGNLHAAAERLGVSEEALLKSVGKKINGRFLQESGWKGGYLVKVDK